MAKYQAIMNCMKFTSLLVLLASCGFPGPIFKYNREVSEIIDSTTKTIREEHCYFCFDYDKNFQCQRIKEVTKDTISNKTLSHSIIKCTEYRMRGGRQKRFQMNKEFDLDGNLIKKEKIIHRNYGRYGRERRFTEVEYLDNGQKKVIKRRGTKRNPKKLEKIRYYGKKFHD